MTGHRGDHQKYGFMMCVCVSQDEELARQLVELGYRGSGEVLKREDFEARKLAAAASKQARGDQKKYGINAHCIWRGMLYKLLMVVLLCR